MANASVAARHIGIRLVAVATIAAAAVACGSNPPTQTPAVPATPSQVATASLPAASGSPTPGLPTASPSPTPQGSPSPYALLDGLPADAAVGQRLPVAVMVDDNAVARPQYGFNAASIVYQAPADGGEDRYMMVFQESDAPRVEPIRSGRPYFVMWASEYRAAFAHYGGDAKTLAYIPTIDGRTLYNVDALFGSGAAFHRDSKRTAPHNAYSSSDAIRSMAVRHGAPSTMRGDVGLRPFADDLPAAQRPTRGSILIQYGTGATGYTYDATSNGYLRSVAGRPQLDAADGKRVTARNVVVLYMGLSIDPESEPGHARPVLDLIGSGKALVFRDGWVFTGTWRKDSASGLTRFYDRSGNEITLVRGRIFIQVVATGTKVTYDARS